MAKRVGLEAGQVAYRTSHVIYSSVYGCVLSPPSDNSVI